MELIWEVWHGSYSEDINGAYVYNIILLTHVDVKQCSAFHK